MLFKTAPLHDIGKVGIPDHILLKPGRFEPHAIAKHGARTMKRLRHLKQLEAVEEPGGRVPEGTGAGVRGGRVFNANPTQFTAFRKQS